MRRVKGCWVAPSRGGGRGRGREGVYLPREVVIQHLSSPGPKRLAAPGITKRHWDFELKKQCASINSYVSYSLRSLFGRFGFVSLNKDKNLHTFFSGNCHLKTSFGQ